MTKRQVAELLAFIKEIYPNFEITQSKINTWHRLMINQDFNRVMRKADEHIKTNPYPPTVANLVERKDEAYSNDFLEKVEKWRAEAVDKPRS